ncbi:helix-turn-helix domain-containing protein [Streptomyces rectiverticillatus]|uniref:citrate synthase family protein n=1 Tax=Streptomyces rectiverticillatus TaxID=173860 RepID=UPI0015C2E55C|nr:citrate synthase family protein [Streptomyces rectiverticillatus]QLE74341.1 helix-turn-helix domain-containing protein [Streptomyces rectiverticillatus]
MADHRTKDGTGRQPADDVERDGVPGERLTTREVAERLGVKPETVYAYVSRGQLTSRRGPGGRGSTFDAREVDALVRRGRRETAFGGETAIRTGVTLIEKDRYFYRGVDATALAERYGYEEVAEWLWTGRLRPGTRFTAPEDGLIAALRAVSAMPAHSGPTDCLRVAAIAAAAADPMRFDLSPEAVLGTARGLIPTLVDALPAAGRLPREDAGGTPLPRRLWSRLTAQAPDEASLRALEAALVLLIDHDLAASTLAVRVAASARSHPYAAVSAGLGVMEGPLHGAASGLAHRMLTEVLQRGSAGAVVADHLRGGRRVPGLGHRLYPGPDPRATALFARLESVPASADALEAAREVEATTARHVALHANVDLALAVLSVSAEMPPEAGETVFAVARTAGWIAHALEEYTERPLRMRPTGAYSGPRPPQPMP